MSASSKKKLRNAEKLSQLTERQQAEQKEAKKLKIFSIAMVAVMVVMMVFAVYIVASKAIAKANLGKAERETVAVTIGDHEISAAEFNCFFVDAVSNFYSQYGSYASLFGLDVTKALDQQFYDEENKVTWADEFANSAKDNVKAVYGIADEAKANGFTLSDDDKAYLETQMSTLSAYASLYGYSNVNGYLQAMYGNGANEEIVRDYFEVCYTAQAYQQSVSDALEYTDADIEAKDAENPAVFSTFSYNSYYMAASKFLEGGEKDAEGNMTYSDEEQAAAVEAAKAAAESLMGAASVEEFNKAIAALEINAEVENAASTASNNTSYDYVNSILQSWVTDSKREEGEMNVIASTTTDEDGKETINGYYAVYFTGRDDNEVLMQNVRHILTKFEGGKTDDNGTTTYSDEEKAAAKETAEQILADWKAGEATEDSFAALANEKSDDGDGTTGGLYENVYPGKMVTNFNDWLFDASRVAGDTDVVETEYGYHVMYYVGASEQTYRNYMIENALRSADVEAWYNGIVEAQTLTDGNLEYIPGGMILNSGSTSTY
ncbi:MAG: peptidylprolyl isomerase [Oscillospiraceae bacterium]|nr:peptidylprolyl isomerase [Oscillospiraceae bacterium]